MKILIGKMKAKALLFTGDTIDAEKALDLGLITQIVDDEALMEEAMTLAEHIARKSTIPLRFIKTLVNRGLDINLAAGNSLEVSHLTNCFSTHDQKEGMNAFLEKRKANFKNE